ncbi:hypothetical protein MK338_09855, partial [Streptococcus vestibularis]|nr:hypothetical protein [Streptococcus vestibularis]
VHIDVDPAE